MTVVGVIAEQGSSLNMNRMRLDKVCGAVKCGEMDSVLVKNVTRLCGGGGTGHRGVCRPAASR